MPHREYARMRWFAAQAIKAASGDHTPDEEDIEKTKQQIEKLRAEQKSRRPVSTDL